jgi:hypothetical protein
MARRSIGHSRGVSDRKIMWRPYVLLNSKLWFSCWIMDKLRPGGALRWKVETAGWEGREVVCGKSTPPRL